MVVTGCGAGLLNGETAKVSMSVIPPERGGMASGISGTLRFIGLVTGITGLGASGERDADAFHPNRCDIRTFRFRRGGAARSTLESSPAMLAGDRCRRDGARGAGCPGCVDRGLPRQLCRRVHLRADRRRRYCRAWSVSDRTSCQHRGDRCRAAAGWRGVSPARRGLIGADRWRPAMFKMSKCFARLFHSPRSGRGTGLPPTTIRSILVRTI